MGMMEFIKTKMQKATHVLDDVCRLAAVTVFSTYGDVNLFVRLEAYLE